jgi:Family of unknown function (DUF6502)
VRRELHSKDPLKEAAIIALGRVVGPLLEMMLDAGVTTREFHHLIRDQAVRIATSRVIKESGRNSKSRVAIMTGLSRSEVARILRTPGVPGGTGADQHPTRRILAAWFDNPRFLTANGEPAVLPVFGKRRSFETLVSLHSGGIPVRAMLDELLQIDAVELDNQRVRAKSRIPILTGLTKSAIAGIGERARDLLDTLTKNAKRTSQPLFEATSLVNDADPDMVSVVRREIAEQGESFINGATSILYRSRKRSSPTTRKVSKKCRIGVTVYYFQDEPNEKSQSDVAPTPRKNLRRQRRSSGISRRRGPAQSKYADD